MYFSILLYNVYSLQYNLLVKKQFVKPGITKTTFKHPTHRTYNYKVKWLYKVNSLFRLICMCCKLVHEKRDVCILGKNSHSEAISMYKTDTNFECRLKVSLIFIHHKMSGKHLQIFLSGENTAIGSCNDNVHTGVKYRGGRTILNTWPWVLSMYLTILCGRDRNTVTYVLFLDLLPVYIRTVFSFRSKLSTKRQQPSLTGLSSVLSHSYEPLAKHERTAPLGLLQKTSVPQYIPEIRETAKFPMHQD